MKPVLFSFLMLFSLTPFAHAKSELKISPPKSNNQKNKKCSGYDLFQAIELNELNCLKSSLKNMDIDERNEEGETPLQVAVRKRAYPLIVELIKDGADLNKMNYRSQTARNLADELGEKEISNLLEKVEIETDRLLAAIDSNDLNSVKASLHRGASIGTRDVRLDSPLHRAAQSNFTEIASILIANGASVHAKNYLGETPLHSAAMRGFLPMMKILIEHGANINAVDERRQTPMDLAQTSDSNELWRFLKSRSAHGGTAAHVSLEVSGGDGQNTDYFQAANSMK